MAKHKCIYYLVDASGTRVCSVCGEPAPEKHEVKERALPGGAKDKAAEEARLVAEAKAKEEEEAKLKEEADAKAKDKGKPGEAPSGH